ncbi:hypothetical protein DC31_07955 [Microbacterium sp. CH12i]|uniref:hypothetical protein n=1 Tax=Microbacterium sp. CH12i TaxID=1479651 RepID=UPI000461F643|nr:hypothetical protein [Microbacterium sp. CH12i]KDA06891.1 hypothetical protein DC31_07955 [Microbacterium sp. CH12i]
MTGSGAVEGAAERAPVDAASASKRTRWITAVSDRVPAKWLGGIATGIVLAATAAFGGLASVPVPALPELVAGETFTGASLEMTVEQASILDERRETGVTAAEGERLLVLTVEVTNIDDEPRPAISDGSVSEIRIDGVGDVKPTIARLDDGTTFPWLQSGVPAELTLTWAVPTSLFVDRDDVRIALYTATKKTGSFVITGTFWDDITTGAHLTIPVDDLDMAAGG